MPLDEQGNIVAQAPGSVASETEAGLIAPPGYGEHVLDQLYEGVDGSGFQTPAVQSGLSTPYFSHSRAGSAENLPTLTPGIATETITAAALSSRLQNVSLDASQRNTSFNSIGSLAASALSAIARPGSSPMSRNNSDEGTAHSGRVSPEHIDFPELAVLNKVPSYATAVRTPARSRTYSGGVMLPDYQTALSAPGSPLATEVPTPDPLSTIDEGSLSENFGSRVRSSSSSSSSAGLSVAEARTPRTSWPQAPSRNLTLLRSHSGDMDERRRLHLIQARG